VEKARECSRLNAEDDTIAWIDTGAKQESSLPVCIFCLIILLHYWHMVTSVTSLPILASSTQIACSAISSAVLA